MTNAIENANVKFYVTVSGGIHYNDDDTQMTDTADRFMIPATMLPDFIRMITELPGDYAASISNIPGDNVWHEITTLEDLEGTADANW